MIDACYIETYSSDSFNSIMRMLESLNEKRAEDIIAKIERYSYFEASEMEKPEKDRKITVSWNASDLVFIMSELIKRLPSRRTQDSKNWFDERLKSFAGQHGDPEWYVRFVLRPFNRERLEKIGPAAGEILLKKGKMLIRLSGFTPPSEPELFYADVLAGRFSLISKDNALSYLYEIRLIEEKSIWNICEFISEKRKKKEEPIRTSEKEVNYKTLEIC